MRTGKNWRLLGQGMAILTLTAALAACGGSSSSTSSSSSGARTLVVSTTGSSSSGAAKSTEGLSSSGSSSGATPSASGTTQALTEIYALSWAPWSSGTGAHIYPMVTFYYPTAVPATVAQSAASAPSGKAALLLLHATILGNKGDLCISPSTGQPTTYQCPYFQNGTSATQAWFNQFFTSYQSAGGRLDYLVADSEVSLSNWAIGTATPPYDAISSDSRYSNQTLSPLLTMGKSMGLTKSEMPPLSEIGSQYTDINQIGVWNELMTERVGAALSAAVYTPLKSLYPDAKMSDYGYSFHNPEFPIWDPNGWPQAQFGEGVLNGNFGAPALYGQLKQITLGIQGRSPTGQAFPVTAFNGFRYDVNTIRAVVLGTQLQLHKTMVSVSPWVAYLGYTGSAYRTTDYYQEMVIHAVLSGASYVLYWNPPNQGDNGPNDDEIMSAVLTELNSVVGYSDRQTVVTGLSSWTSNNLVSTTYANGQKVSRLTHAQLSSGAPTLPTCTSAKSLLTCTYSDDGSAVHFPSGTVYSSPLSSSTYGIWVIQLGTASNPY
jgi:hypothetical protein